MADEPRCIEVSVQYSGGGKVAIRDFGKITSNWGVSMSRRYEVPEGFSEEDIDAFQVTKRDELKALVEPIDQEEFDLRYAQHKWDNE
jgi:hypothetical protein